MSLNRTGLSEFHFGAGESSIIRIVTDIELLPENSMILVEEIENGLHPMATKRLVEYLIAAAQRRNIQVIFTTHSDDALEVLPSDGVWACLDGQTQQGKLSIRTLRAISGKVDTSLAIFTEDEFSRHIVETAIREFNPNVIEQVEVHGIAGDGNAVKVHTTRRGDPTARFNSLCVIDGDSSQRDDEGLGIFRLPGQQPEQQVFSDILANIANNIALLTVSLHLDPIKQDTVRAVMERLSSTNRDPHVIFNQIGIELGFIPESIVKGAFLSLWIRSKTAEFKGLMQRIILELL